MRSTALLTLLHEPPSNPETLGTEIAAFLQQFQEPMVNGNGPYVHPRVISFHNDQDRTNWIGYMPDAMTRDLFTNFGPRPTHGKQTLITLICAPNGTLIGNQWEHRVWHAFVVLIANSPTGKRILIWDCDPVEGASEDKRWKEILWGKQRSFVQYLRDKRKMSKAEIWYSTDPTDSGRDECLLLSLRKVWEWASLGDMSYQGTDDPRFQHCIKLKN